MPKTFSMRDLKHVFEGVLAAGLVVLTTAMAQAQTVVHPTPNDTVIMVNGQPHSGTISDAQGPMSFAVFGTDTHVLSVDGHRVQLGSAQEKAAIARVNAGLAAYAKNGPSPARPTETGQTVNASTPAAPIAANTGVSVEFSAGGHVIVHRETSTVDLSGDTATVTFSDSPILFQMQYRHDGVARGLLRSATRGGRSFATSGWSFSMSGREMYDSRNGGFVPGGNGGIVMNAARELLAAMDDAQAQASKIGQSYAPVGKQALQDMVSAHSDK
jgi:hypothetical protein